MKRLFVLLVLFVLALDASAATNTAVNPTLGAVMTAYNACNDGDTLAVPAGSATWAGALNITKAITVRGAGAGNTIISVNTGPETWAWTYHPANAAADLPFRITGFTFDLNFNAFGWNCYNGDSAHPIHNVRIDHNIYTNCLEENPDANNRQHVCFTISGAVCGVADHNFFYGEPWWHNDGNNADDWNNRTVELGTVNTFVIEDNVFNGPWGICGAGNGGRYCARYNIHYLTATSLFPCFDVHGNQGPGVYGSMQGEAYGNIIHAPAMVGPYQANGIRLFHHRGGVGRCFYNVVEQDVGSFEVAVQEEYDDAFDPINNPIPEHVSDSYYWNNRKGGFNGSLGVVNISTDGNQGSPYTLMADRDFWVFTPSFDGSTGMGAGTHANRPSPSKAGVGYWETTQSVTTVPSSCVGTNPSTPISGTLFVADGSGAWIAHYTPLVYPHPMVTAQDSGETTSPPSIISQPSAVTNWSGANVIMSVSASGGGTLTYQWQMNSNNVPGQTTANYRSNNAPATVSGWYRCMATNEAGGTGSQNVYVQITNAAPYITTQPTNIAAYLSDTVTFYIGPAGSTPQTNHWRKGGSIISNATNTSYTIASAASADAATYDCVVSNQFGNVTSSGSILTVSTNVQPGIIRSYGAATSTNNFNTFTIGGVNCSGTANRLLLLFAITYDSQNNAQISSVTFNGTGLTKYSESQYYNANGYLSVWALTNAPAVTASIIVNGTSISEAVFNVVVITNAPNTAVFETFTTSNSGQNQVNSSSLSPISVGGELVVDALVSSSVSSWANGQTLITTADNANSTQLRSSWRRSTSGTTVMSWTGPSDAVAQVAVAIKSNTGGGGPPSPTPPSFIVYPTGFTDLVGTTIPLIVTVIGDPPLVFQWRMNSNDVAGATLAKYTNVFWDVTNSGNWQCYVTNAVGAVTSIVAVVTITNGVAPTFATNPTPTTNHAGVLFYLLSSANGNSPITYQWQKDGAKVNGATLNNYTNANPLAGDSGSYAAVAANAFGSKTSTVAYVSVTNVPVTSRPVNVFNLSIGSLKNP